VAAALIRDRGKYERQNVPGGLLRTRIDQLLKLRVNVVVDTLPGIEPSQNLARHFLAAGVPVVTANKVLIADSGFALTTLARGTGAPLRLSAAVGAAAPMIETVERCAASGPISSLAAVLNGTCNFVLERCSQGTSLSAAVAEAQRAGFAERDASEDLSGRDAARKLRILSRHAFGVEPSHLAVEPTDEAVADRARASRQTGRVLRQVARAAPCEGEVRATVRLEEVPAHSPFALLEDEWNALQIATQDGALHTVTGRGAGRWPTAEALMADLFDIRRLLLGSFIRLPP
jgi:homoserine dehydrogenase